LTARVVYADEALIALDKPAGLLAVPGRGADKQDCLAARVQALYPDACVVHRLDMATSGLLLMARSPHAQRQLSIAFAQRRVRKRYVAVVEGLVRDPEGEIDLPLAPDWPQRPRQRVDTTHGKPSLTRYRVLSVDHTLRRTRLSLEPVTGRSHQLRVHLLAIGHRIVGDTLYGAPPHDRLLLHASELTLEHPVSGATVGLESEVPF
jgi:tRNA pseudouridine32 synthase / 23S rRNA pseudouridine746 synthase